MLSKKRVGIGLAVACLCFVIIMGVGRRCIGNQINLWMSRGYFIPAESSMCEFSPLTENEGSGEWWEYGEDRRYYYYAGDGALPRRYVKTEKASASQCVGFRPTEVSSWCHVLESDAETP